MSELDKDELRATRKLNGVEWEEDKEIHVGDYVRTKDGRIYQVNSSNDEWALSDIFYKVITKHSPNLIDLIEVGDYVNEHKVQQVFIDPFTKKKRLLIEGTEVNWQGDMSSVYCEAEEIKTIVTHEQFNSVMYKVKE